MSKQPTDCPHCHATPSTGDERVIIGNLDGEPTEMWHKNDCPDRLSPERKEAPSYLRLVRPDEETTP